MDWLRKRNWNERISRCTKFDSRTNPFFNLSLFPVDFSVVGASFFVCWAGERSFPFWRRKEKFILCNMYKKCILPKSTSVLMYVICNIFREPIALSIRKIFFFCSNSKIDFYLLTWSFLYKNYIYIYFCYINENMYTNTCLSGIFIKSFKTPEKNALLTVLI